MRSDFSANTLSQMFFVYFGAFKACEIRGPHRGRLKIWAEAGAGCIGSTALSGCDCSRDLHHLCSRFDWIFFVRQFDRNLSRSRFYNGDTTTTVHNSMRTPCGSPQQT